MSVWSLIFPSKNAREQRANEEAELAYLGQRRRDTAQVAQSSSRVMTTMAGAMQLMARGHDEDR